MTYQEFLGCFTLEVNDQNGYAHRGLSLEGHNALKDLPSKKVRGYDEWPIRVWTFACGTQAWVSNEITLTGCTIRTGIVS